MPTKSEKDTAAAVEIRHHEWDGIQEMDNPLPRWWLYVFYATVAASLVYYVLYPSVPGITGYTPGILDYNERKQVERKLADARAAQGVHLTRIQAASAAEIRDDPELLNFALAGGRAAFADNCAPCHAPGGAGRPGGFPVLADDAWIWGGTLDAIEVTLRHGIRWDADEDTRVSDMPRFGADELLTREQISDVTQYVLAFTGRTQDAEAAARGEPLYAEQCVACHGAQGEGNAELGAPRLSDQVWLYEGTADAIAAQIHAARQGVMPAWEGRLDDSTIKMLTVYVHSLGGGK